MYIDNPWYVMCIDIDYRYIDVPGCGLVNTHLSSGGVTYVLCMEHICMGHRHLLSHCAYLTLNNV